MSDETLESISQIPDANQPVDNLPPVTGQVVGNSPFVESLQIGGKYSFGGYIWRILDMKNDKALLLSEDIVEKRSYHNRSANIT